MAKLAPFFLTGANAKVRVNNKTIAFCQDVSYRVRVPHAEPTLLGMYEPANLEPLSYKVEGSFTIIKYTRDVASIMKSEGKKVPHGVQDEGNGVGKWGPDDVLARNGLGTTDGQAHRSLNPADLDEAVGFDIEIYQKLSGGRQCAVARLRSCRIELAGFTLNKRGVATQQFTFKALYADEDTFTADMSGRGQNFG